MSTSYRKNSYTAYPREFYKITESVLLIVQLKQNSAMISISKNRFLFDEYRDSPEATEQEFEIAYKDALSRITLQRLDI